MSPGGELERLSDLLPFLKKSSRQWRGSNSLQHVKNESIRGANAVCFHTNTTYHCIADDQTCEGHTLCVRVCVGVCLRERESLFACLCVWSTLPIIFFYAAACQGVGGYFIMYAMLLEFIPYYLSCIKYEPIWRPS